jgi:hypothetical protein
MLRSNLILVYGANLLYTLVTHRDVFAAHATSESERAEKPEVWPVWQSFAVLALATAAIAWEAEIVSGALQDHDRSLVVGETTFGKALVQSVYRVNGGAGAAITTARYYTPSGRLIQRPWDGSFDEYLSYTAREQDPNKAHKPEELKYTDGGRKVYSGGGVEPDRRFDGPLEGFNPTRQGRLLYMRTLFDNYAQRFRRQGDTRIADPLPQLLYGSRSSEFNQLPNLPP